MPDRPEVFVHLLPSLIPPGALRGGIAVVVDVLRATTAMAHAFESGIESIIPCLEVEEARGLASSLPTGAAILGGERQGLPIEGFDLGNSPCSYSPEVCRSKTLVMTTTNGTKALHASLDADRVLIASYPTWSATLRVLEADQRSVHIVCAGTNGQISLEDSFLAGDLAAVLWTRGRQSGNDEADLARLASYHLEKQSDTTRAEFLAMGRGGRRVTEIGLAADILDASAVDRFDFAAELLRDPLRIVRI